MVWSRAARNIPIIRPMRMVTICLCVRAPSSWTGDGVDAPAAEAITAPCLGKADEVGAGPGPAGAAAAAICSSCSRECSKPDMRRSREPMKALASSSVQSARTPRNHSPRWSFSRSSRSVPALVRDSIWARPSWGSGHLLDEAVGDQAGHLPADGRDVGVHAAGEVGDPAGAVVQVEQDRVRRRVDAGVQPGRVLPQALEELHQPHQLVAQLCGGVVADRHRGPISAGVCLQHTSIRKSLRVANKQPNLCTGGRRRAAAGSGAGRRERRARARRSEAAGDPRPAQCVMVTASSTRRATASSPLLSV